MQMDLSSAVFADLTMQYSNGKWTWSGVYVDAIFPSLVLDSATSYSVEVDFEDPASPGCEIYLYSSISGEHDAGFNTSSWYTLGESFPTSPTGTAIITIGPGISDWDAAMDAGEKHIIFEVGRASAVTGVRVSSINDEDPVAVIPVPVILSTSSTKRAINVSYGKTEGRTLLGYQARINGGDIIDLDPDSHAYSFTDLAPAHRYVVEVRAVEADGTSAWVSKEESTSADVPAVVTVPGRTRYYIMPGSNTTPPSPPVAYSSDWFKKPAEVSAGVDAASRRPMSVTPPAPGVSVPSALASRPWVYPVVPNDSVALQLIFPAFDNPRLVSGYFRMVIGATYIGSASLKVILRLMSADGKVEKGIFNTLTGTPVFDGNQYFTRTVEGQLAPLEAKAGDFLVAEVGFDFAWGLGGSAGLAGHDGNPDGDAPFEEGYFVNLPGTKRPWVEIDLVEPTSTLSWEVVNPHYETGLDRGVLYPEEGPGVAWNGLVSVEDSHVGGEVEGLYADGIKYLDLPSGRNYQATLTAYQAPEEFAPSNGEIQVKQGLIFTRQQRRRFGFSYRTIVGDNLGYQIHLVYNALATPTGRGYRSRSSSPSPSISSWQIDAVPIESSAPRPTAHFIIDSTKIGIDPMRAIEGVLYGTKNRDPYLPSIDQINAIANQWDPKTIHEIPTSNFYELFGGMGDLQVTDVDGVYISLPDGRLSETGVNGLYQLTE